MNILLGFIVYEGVYSKIDYSDSLFWCITARVGYFYKQNVYSRQQECLLFKH